MVTELPCVPDLRGVAGSPRRRGCAGDLGAGQGEGFPPHSQWPSYDVDGAFRSRWWTPCGHHDPALEVSPYDDLRLTASISYENLERAKGFEPSTPTLARLHWSFSRVS